MFWQSFASNVNVYFRRAINMENNEANKIKNILTGDWAGVPDVARNYKSRLQNIKNT